ncbi:MAG TPA: YetF domain-containing protein [Burkholderiales bacterium]|nr:YetF domain-containing protein [Burkholderiales bacterium]
MDMVLRALAVYLFLLVVLRLSGKRALSQVTTFDFVLLLIVAEATQQALLGEDFSVTNAVVVIVTLVFIDIALSMIKQRRPRVAQVLEDVPLVLVEEGRPLRERMDKVQVDDADILSAARELQGLERMEQIKYAVLERHGGITIVPKPEFR